MNQLELDDLIFSLKMDNNEEEGDTANCGLCEVPENKSNMSHIKSKKGFDTMIAQLELLSLEEECQRCKEYFKEENLFAHSHCRNDLYNKLQKFLKGTVL